MAPVRDMAPVGETAPGCLEKARTIRLTTHFRTGVGEMAPIGEMEPGCERKRKKKTKKKTIALPLAVCSPWTIAKQKTGPHHESHRKTLVCKISKWVEPRRRVVSPFISAGHDKSRLKSEIF